MLDERIASGRPRPLPLRAANHAGAYDFVFDACANGQQLKCLSIFDAFTRECLAILKRLTDNKVETVHIDPGKPWQNGTNESFDGRLRDECLGVQWFRTRRGARIVVEAWRRRYDAVPPRSSPSYLTPVEFGQRHHVRPLIPNRAISRESVARDS